jgi:hypothetical protein
LKVGVNYAWPYNFWASLFDPGDGRDIEKTVPANFARLRKLGVSCVRIWLLATAEFYGNPPKLRAPTLPERDARNWEFTPPREIGDDLVKRFVRLVNMAFNSGIELIPVLLDFGVFQSPALRIHGNPGGGKIDLAIDPDKRNRFVNGTLKKFLSALTASERATIYAFEVMNEPDWELRRPNLVVDKTKHGVLLPSELAGFLSACLAEISTDSTVGFSHFGFVKGFPCGTRPQFHYYGPSETTKGIGTPFRYYLPDAASRVCFPPFIRKLTPFVGEIDGAIRVKGSWPSCKGADRAHDALSLFNRLSKLREKGYQLALVWPDLPDSRPEIANQDALKFSAETQKAIKAFTDGMDLTNAKAFFSKVFNVDML